MSKNVAGHEGFVIQYNHDCTGYSLSEALILASINPKYDDRLFVELPVQYLLRCISNCSEGKNKNNLMYTTCTELVIQQKICVIFWVK